MKPNVDLRAFQANSMLAMALLLVPSQTAQADVVPPNVPQMVKSDGKLQLEWGDERIIVPHGLQPYLFCTSSGTIVVQAQVPDKPFPSERISYPTALATVVSRDEGATWEPIPLKTGDNGINLEGGGLQLRDGSIVAMDTYITPGPTPGSGVGLIYRSYDDWKTVERPVEVPFELPEVDFYASDDDAGRPHVAIRAHRRILELPNGDLLTTLYGGLHGDETPCTYEPKMMKQRTMLVRSTDRGRSWKMISHMALSSDIGTEGLVEAVICRISKAPHLGRIICLMRTGRNMYQAISADDGKTWSTPQEIIFAGLDVNRTELWIDQFRHVKDSKGRVLDESNLEEVRGAVVDPDLIELRSGVLVAAFGIRIPQKQCWNHPEHPWNGNYLAFSFDHGETWDDVVRITSGVPTTHYMAITEMPEDNQLFVSYDLGGWSKGMRRNVVGRKLKITQK